MFMDRRFPKDIDRERCAAQLADMADHRFPEPKPIPVAVYRICTIGPAQMNREYRTCESGYSEEVRRLIDADLA